MDEELTSRDSQNALGGHSAEGRLAFASRARRGYKPGAKQRAPYVSRRAGTSHSAGFAKDPPNSSSRTKENPRLSLFHRDCLTSRATCSKCPSFPRSLGTSGKT